MQISQFGKNILTLFTGSVIAQAVPILISPILTREYSPNAFGEYAFYLSIVTIMSVFATCRYDLAVMIADDEKKSNAVMALSISISISVTVLLLLVGVIISFLDYLNNYITFIYLGAIQVGMIGIYNTLYHKLNRDSLFKQISFAAFVQSFSIAIYQVLTGLWLKSGFNLALGSFIGQLSAIIFILYFDKRILTVLFQMSKDELIYVAKRFSKFPKYDLWAGLFNIGFQQIPVVLISSLFGKSYAGHFSLTQRILQVPTSLIGGSVLGAFRVKSIEEVGSKGECTSTFLKILKFMFIMGIVPSIIILLAGKQIFVLIFGGQWEMAGLFSQIMIVMFFLKFITSPLTYMFYIAERQNWNFIGQILFIISTIVSFFVGYYYKDIIIALIIYTVTNSILYIIYLFISYLFAKGLYVDKTEN